MINNFPEKNNNYTYLQTNRSDDLGSLWSTFNIDLQSNLGTMRVAPRLLQVNSTEDLANLGGAVGFKYIFNLYWTIAGTRVFKGTTANEPQNGFVEDTSTSFRTDYDPTTSDLEMFGGKLYTTADSGLYSKSSASGAWSLHSGTPNGGLLCFFRKFNRLYVITNSSQVDSTDGTTYASSGDYTIQLGSSTENTIISICETSDSIWLGTLNKQNQAGRASVYRWDGISAQPTSRYYLNAPGAYSLVVKDDIPYVMDTFGVFSKFTGSAFEEIGRLPFYDGLMSDDATGYDDYNTRFIHPKGMISTKNNTFLVLIRNNYSDSTDSIPENCPSGIWEFSEDYGFIHKYALTYTPVSNNAITDYGQNQIGTFSNDGYVGGLSQAWTEDNDPERDGMILCGATFFTNATTQTSAIFIDNSLNTVKKKGYFVTTWFNSNEIEDKWIRLWSVHKRFLSSSDSIVYKYRLYEESPITATITWTSTTTFTTTDDVSAYAPTATGFDGVTGGEVEGIQGAGSGQCAHVISVVNNAGTYTVILDTVMTGVSGTARVRLQKWIKLFPEITGQIKSWEQLFIGMNNTRIQIKGCLTFTDLGTNANEFHKMALVSHEDIKIN